MIYSYKGTEYEFPDNMPDDEALKLIRADQGETEAAQIAPASEPAPAADPQQPPEGGGLGQWLKGMGEFYTQDIPAAAKGVAQRFQERGRSVEAPTTTARMLGIQEPSTLSDLVGTPERAGRAFLQAGGSLADIVGAAASLAPKAAARWSGGASEKVTKPVAETLSSIVGPAAEAFGRYKGGLSPSEQANLEAAAGGAEFLTTGAGMKAVPGAARAPGKAISAAGRAEQAMAGKVQSSISKFNKNEVDQGARLENVFKYELSGKPSQMAEQAQAIIIDSARKLKDVLEEGAEIPGNRINIFDSMTKARSELMKYGKAKNYDLEAAWNKANEHLKEVYSKNGVVVGDVDLVEAQMLKRYAGERGDWMANPGGGMRPSIEASNEALVYDKIYSVLKRELENKGGPEVKRLNKVMNDLIPIERAAYRRALVAGRNEAIPLKEYVGIGLALAGHPMEAALIGAQMASKSPMVAKGLYKMGKGTETLGQILTPGEPTLKEVIDNFAAKIRGERGSIGIEKPQIPDKYLRAYELGKEINKKKIDLNEALYGMHGKKLADDLDRLLNNDDQATFFEIGRNGNSFPEYVIGERYGEIPTGGRSINFRENKFEKGMSLMNLEGEKPGISAKMYELFNKGSRKKQKYGGWLVGYGSDGEPLILGAKKITDESGFIGNNALLGTLGMGVGAGAAGVTGYELLKR